MADSNHLTPPGFTCRLCRGVLPAWMPLGDRPVRVDTAMLLGHLRVQHPSHRLGEIPDGVEIFASLVPNLFEAPAGFVMRPRQPGKQLNFYE
jgi:hypothetical protein